MIDAGAGDFATRYEVAALRRELRELKLYVGQLALRRSVDAHLGDVLAKVYVFARSTAWSASEILEDARRSDRALWAALDAIVGPRGDAAIRLGCWLARHAGAEADGLRLVRVHREGGTWLYRVEPVELKE